MTAATGVYVGVWIPEVNVVEDIEGIRAKLHNHALRNEDVLGDSQIALEEAGTAQRIAGCVTDLSRAGPLPRADGLAQERLTPFWIEALQCWDCARRTVTRTADHATRVQKLTNSCRKVLAAAVGDMHVADQIGSARAELRCADVDGALGVDGREGQPA